MENGSTIGTMITQALLVLFLCGVLFMTIRTFLLFSTLLLNKPAAALWERLSGRKVQHANDDEPPTASESGESKREPKRESERAP